MSIQEWITSNLSSQEKSGITTRSKGKLSHGQYPIPLDESIDTHH